MRNELVISKSELTYEIRNIVSIAEKLQAHGVTINWENIGDPIVKGEDVPGWMKEIVCRQVHENRSWGYSHTRGELKTREFVAARTNLRGGAQITPEDIIFFNGLGDAIAKVYASLAPEVRVLLPSPTYTVHALGEAKHAHTGSLHYRLLPERNWIPDLDDLEKHVKYNPQVSGIMLINPDNPTGMVYAQDTLEQIVSIAKKYDLFIISDEVYINIVYNGHKTVPISDVIGTVPGMALKGVSKEFPWPGSRCGWIEIYNAATDSRFDKYVNNILKSKMNEVCSTTLPQRSIPEIMSHPEYPVYLAERIDRYEKMSNITYDILREVPGLIVNRSNGAFYMSVVFKAGVLKAQHSLPIADAAARALVEGLVALPGTLPDKRFVYYLLAHSGICLVPLSSFCTDLQGFRVTLLERDEQACKRIYQTLAAKIDAYLQT